MDPADLAKLIELLTVLPDQIFAPLLAFLVLLILKECIK